MVSRTTAELLLVLVTVIWGLTFVLVKEGISAWPVFPFLMLRFGLATLFLLPFAITQRRFLTRRTWLRGGFLGGWMTLTYVLQTIGLSYTTASNSGLITGLYIVFTAIFGAWFFKLPVPRRVWVGTVIAVIGLVLLTGGLTTPNLGDALTLGCAMSIAMHILWVDRLTGDENAVLLTILQLLTVTLVCAVLSIQNVPLSAPPPETWTAVVVCAILATGFAYWAQTMAQKILPPQRVAMLFLLEPPFAVLFAVLIGQERLDMVSALGAAVILCGIVLAERARTQHS